MPRVKGNSPGNERSRSGSNAARSVGPMKAFMGGRPGPRGSLMGPILLVGAICAFCGLIRLFDLRFFRRDAERAQETAIVDGHVERLSGDQRLRGGHALGGAVAAVR